SIAVDGLAERGRVYDGRALPGADQLQNVLASLGEFFDLGHVDTQRADEPSGAGGRHKVVSEPVEPLDDRNDLGLVLVRDRHEYFSAARGRETGGDERLPQSRREGAVDPHDLARALHLRTEVGVDVEQLRHRKDRRLERDELTGRPDPVRARVALGAERRTERDRHRELHQRDAGDLRKERHGPARAWIHLEHPHASVLHDELDVEKTFHGQRLRDAPCQGNDLVALGGKQILRGIDGVAVAGVDAGPLDVLHDPGDERLAPVGYSVDLDLLAAKIFVDEHASRTGFEGRMEIALEVVRSVGDLHAAALEHGGDRFLVERIEVQARRRVEVGRDGLWIAVHHDRSDTSVAERTGGLHAAAVELDALANANRPAAEDDSLWSLERSGLVFLFVRGVEVRRHRLE